MKKYLIRSSIFMAILVTSFGINYMLNSYFIKSNPYKIKEEKNVLILGDSHPMSTCDPKIIEHSKNVCVGGEPFFVSFHKLKYLVKYNPQINTIILGFGYHNTSAFNDFKLSTGAPAKTFMESSYSLFSHTDLKGVDSDSKKYLNAIIHNMLLFPKTKHHGFIGRFKRDNNFLINKVSVDGPLKRHFSIKGEKAGVSKDNLTYLEKIVQFCKEKDINLFLINTPLHADYRDAVEDIYLKAYQEKVTEYDKMDRITVLDYSNLVLADSLFRNHDHVNAKGAAIVSKLINEKLVENLK